MDSVGGSDRRFAGNDLLDSEVVGMSEEWAKFNMYVPRYVGGYYVLEDFIVQTVKKPHWFHRLMTRLLLGWKWRDEA